jgi:hypothetical protein
LISAVAGVFGQHFSTSMTPFIRSGRQITAVPRDGLVIWLLSSTGPIGRVLAAVK